MSSVDDWPMASPETKLQGTPYRRWTPAGADAGGKRTPPGRLGGSRRAFAAVLEACRQRCGKSREGKRTPEVGRYGFALPAGEGRRSSTHRAAEANHCCNLVRPATGRRSRVFRRTIVTWLILPVVICLSKRLSHASLSISNYTAKLRTAH